jgi:signal transduction histidine kinase
MNKSRAAAVQTDERQSANDLTSSPIRSQLLWASLFPLLIFGLLTIIVTETVLNRFTLDLVTQRNSARVQLISDALGSQIDQGKIPSKTDLTSASQTAGVAEEAGLLLVDDQGSILVSAGQLSPAVSESELRSMFRDQSGVSTLLQSNATSDELMVSVASITGSPYRVLLIEPWRSIMAPERNYQALLAVLTILGIVFSLGMLSLAIGRVIHPIQIMARQASEAVPGSVFHPLRETGPQEIRLLIDAFNKMVIRLAKQQTAMRQYAHKALLSQEEERLRLSHELHDETLQDLVALNQRVELCQNELTGDADIAHERLNEIHLLLQDTITEVRRMSIALRPPILDDFGLDAAVAALCKEINKSSPHLKCDLTLNGTTRRLPADMELAVFRVIQEALSNIRKHAPAARSVKVELTYTAGSIKACVENDGGNFTRPDIQGHVKAGHLGLAGMEERAKLFGGTFDISSTPGDHTLLTLELPISHDDLQGS